MKSFVLKNPTHSDPSKMTVEELRHCLIHWGDHTSLTPFVEQFENRLTAPKARIRVSVIPNNGYPLVEYTDLDTGKSETVEVSTGECEVFEIDQDKATQLWNTIAWQKEQDGIDAARIDDGSFEG